MAGSFYDICTVVIDPGVIECHPHPTVTFTSRSGTWSALDVFVEVFKDPYLHNPWLDSFDTCTIEDIGTRC